MIIMQTPPRLLRRRRRRIRRRRRRRRRRVHTARHVDARADPGRQGIARVAPTTCYIAPWGAHAIYALATG